MLTVARPIRALHRVREYIAAEPTSKLARSVREEESALEAFEERISSTVYDLVSKVVERWDSSQVLGAFSVLLSEENDPAQHLRTPL